MDNTIYCHITTLPNRTKSLEETVNSLLPQVDEIHIFLHGYNPVDLPVFLEDNPKIKLKYDIEWGDNGDLDKFHSVNDLQGYMLICDDDLIYPPDYAQKMIEAVDRYQRKALISVHGSIMFPLPVAHYYTDRYVYECLNDVLQEVQVQIGGTGVMAFHSDIGFDFDAKEKTVNMADIHIAVWAGNKDIPTVVIPHLTGWIKHSPYVTYDMTIAGKNGWNTFEQVDLINKNPKIFKSKFQKPKSKKPKVTVVVINSRLKSHPVYVKECFDSIRAQSYSNIQFIVIDNLEKLQTIGRCWNKAVKMAKGKYILFVGDDDFITKDYIESLVTIIESESIGLTRIAGISSYLTMFHHPGQSPEIMQEPRELIPTGMYLRKYLKKNPFKEYLTKYVDSEFMNRIAQQRDTLLMHRQQYGYFYRSHSGQQSGFKVLGGAHSVLASDKEKLSEKLKKFEVANESK